MWWPLRSVGQLDTDKSTFSKARKLLGYRPQVSFVDGLAEMSVSRSAGDGEGRNDEQGQDRYRQLRPRPVTER